MLVTRDCVLTREIVAVSRRWARQARRCLRHRGRRREAPVIATVVVDEHLDLRGKRAGDFRRGVESPVDVSANSMQSS